MEGFSVTTERIAAAGGGVISVGESLERELATMEQILHRIRVGWRSSEAAPRFVGSMELYLEQAESIKDVLLSQGQALIAVGDRFREVEGVVAAAVPAVA